MCVCNKRFIECYVVENWIQSNKNSSNISINETKRFQLLFLYFQNKWMKKKQQHDNHCHCAMFIVYFFFWIYLYERENRCNQISWKYRWKKHKRRKCEFQSILDILFDWSSCLKITCTQPQYGMLRTIFARIPHSVHKLSFR